MSIIRIGSNKNYSDGWENAFGKSPKKKSTAKVKKKAAPKKKKAAKR